MEDRPIQLNQTVMVVRHGTPCPGTVVGRTYSDPMTYDIKTNRELLHYVEKKEILSA